MSFPDGSDHGTGRNACGLVLPDPDNAPPGLSQCCIRVAVALRSVRASPATTPRWIVAVRPAGMHVVFHPEVIALTASDPTAKALVDGTLPALRSAGAGHAPDTAMFAKRYAYYPEKYLWLTA